MNELTRFLRREGYDCVVSPFRFFDTVVKQRKRFVIVKYVRNLDGLKEKHANVMKKVSSLLNTDAIVVAERTRRDVMKSGVVYRRYSLPGLSPDTFLDYLEGKCPEAEYNRGRIVYVPRGVAEARKQKGLSRKELADMLGVSYESVYYYEHGMRVREDVFRKMREILNIAPEERLFPGEPCEPSIPETEVDKKLAELKFTLYKITKKTEFASDDSNTVMVETKENPYTKEFADFMNLFLLLIGRSGISKKELSSISSKEELFERIKR